jgi:hypothetical protein
MARKPNGIHLQPAWEFFKFCGVLAEAKIASGREPDWFRETFDREQQQHIEREYGLPSRWPLIVALALDLSFEMTADSLTRFRQKLKAERSRAKKLRAGLLELRDFPDFPLISLNDAIDKMAQAIDTFLEQPVKIGRKTSSVAHAVRLLDEYVEEKNPCLTLTQRDHLCADLFDKVRSLHGDRRRSADSEPGETPRYRDLLSKLMAKRRRSSPVYPRSARRARARTCVEAERGCR